ncbi:hypothetical protein QJS10_CPA03g02211 [Acorus calamus]|uniref:Uncharacterized protein n=1 Tax=Acorus calamus TaxID=4465 RepID=A0AAV9F9X0_ACOCL|nr:hypothetical protein QJS10_CPA03g02211 [Acorus calamus]
MQAPRSTGALMAFFSVLLALSSLAAAASDRAAVTVDGVGKCTNCAKKDVMRGNAFRGLHTKGKYKTSAVAALTNNGEFSVELPSETPRQDSNDNGGLKEECFTELRSASRKPCPSSNGIESSKIVRKYSEGKQPQHVLFGTAGQLVFSKNTCAAAIGLGDIPRIGTPYVRYIGSHLLGSPPLA